MFSILNKNMSSTVNDEAVRLLNMSSLQERIKQALDTCNMKPAALAKKAKVSRATVSLWVNGPTQRIEGENLTRAAAALGVNAHWLATGEGQPYNELKVAEPAIPYGQPDSTTVLLLLGRLCQITDELPTVVRETVAQLMARHIAEQHKETRAEIEHTIKRLIQ